MHKLDKIIENFAKFVSGDVVTVTHAKTIEGELAELLEGTDEKIDNFLDEIACYRPEGGEHLLNYESFLPKAKMLLDYLQSNYEKFS